MINLGQLGYVETYEIAFIIIVILLAVPVLTLLCRELACWYFKINERVEILKDIRDHFCSAGATKKEETECAEKPLKTS